MASYAACFRPRLHGRKQAHCQQYVKGLFHDCRSNVERMNERLPDSSYDALHHFISASSWDGQAVMDEVARRVQTTLGEVAGEQGLLLDEYGWEKAGTDAAYGNSPALRQALQQRGQAYVLDMGPGLQMYLADPPAAAAPTPGAAPVPAPSGSSAAGYFLAANTLPAWSERAPSAPGRAGAGAGLALGE